MTVVASNYARAENDLYQTEVWATEALLRHLDVRGAAVYEPAAGNHLMADVLREQAADVWTADIKTYDRKHDEERDFLSDDRECFHRFIITNPPYGKGNRVAAEFARVALRRCPDYVALLLTAKFDSGKTRVDLFRDNPRFKMKIVLLDRIRWFPGSEMDGTEDHAWYVWGPGVFPSKSLFYEGREPCA